MQLSDYVNLKELNKDIEDGYITVADHRDLPLKLYTYSRKAQYDGHWTEATRKCRGLIVETTGHIVAFCMPKFFNKSEHDNGKLYASPLPAQPFDVYAKMDGSMGTVFFYNNEWHVATKGSFHSDQAVYATNLLRSHNTGYLNTGLTYVVEIIYPGNRIVCDYGETEDLFLITTYTSLGTEYLTSEAWTDAGFPTVKKFPSCSLIDLDDLGSDNITIEGKTVTGTEEEGYVIRFQDGTRVKVKFSDYLSLHKLITNCTERSIWEAMYSDTDLDRFFEGVPDEFYAWAINVVDDIEAKVNMFITSAFRKYRRIVDKVDIFDRKAFAEEALKLDSPYPAAMFRVLDGKGIRDIAFKTCYPEAVKPFRQDNDV